MWSLISRVFDIGWTELDKLLLAGLLRDMGEPIRTRRLIWSLVGAFNPSEKYEFVNWDDEIPNIWENKKCSKPPTRSYISKINTLTPWVKNASTYDVCPGLPWFLLVHTSHSAGMFKLWPSWESQQQKHLKIIRQTNAFQTFLWLVVGPPLWKIWKSIGMMRFPIYGKIKNVPNHQPVSIDSFRGPSDAIWKSFNSHFPSLGAPTLARLGTIGDQCAATAASVPKISRNIAYSGWWNGWWGKILTNTFKVVPQFVS